MVVHPDGIEAEFLSANAKTDYVVRIRHTEIVGDDKAVSHFIAALLGKLGFSTPPDNVTRASLPFYLALIQQRCAPFVCVLTAYTDWLAEKTQLLLN